jgi:ATP-dependent Zn protease
MDGFKNQTAKPVFVLAATNFTVEEGTKKSLDPALMRRFDRRIYVDLPDRDDRIKFMTMKIKSNPAFDISDEMLDNLAVRSTGMSLAALDSVFELSLRMVIRNKKTIVTDSVLDEAFEAFNYGEKRKWNEETLLRTARHEAGHAVICSVNGEIPSYITVVPRGEHGGYMQHTADEDKHIFTKNELLSRIRTALGGRASEIVYYGAENGVSTGAAGDLINATTLARKMVELYGMDDTLGLVACIDQEEMSPETRNAVNKILVAEMNNAIEVIRSNKETVDKLSDALVNKNHLSSNEINKIFKKKA